MNHSSSPITVSIFKFFRRSCKHYSSIRGGFAVAVMLMTLTVGCNSDPQTVGSDNSPTPDTPEIANNQGSRLLDTGWGEIDANTPFNRDRIQALLPNYRVESKQVNREGFSEPVLEVYEGSDRIALIDPQDPNNPNQGILRITIFSDEIEGPERITVGTSYDRTPGSDRFDCFPGEGPTTGYVICRSPESDRLQYIYGAIDNGGRPLMQLPPESVLGNYRLDRLVWLNF